MLQQKSLIRLLHGFMPSAGVDQWTWVEDPGGAYSVKCLRSIMGLNRVPVDLNPVNGLRWTPLKVRCFIWKVRLNKFPIMEALKNVVWRLDQRSVLCV